MAEGEPEEDRVRPHDGEFHRRVLDYLPTPTIVLDDQARVVYLNLAAQEVFGLSEEEALGTVAFDFVHPDDLGWAADVFANVVELGPSPLERSKAGGIHFRVTTADGDVVPVHITGALGFGDPHVRGIVYDIRPDWGPNLMGRIVAGLAHGEPVDQLLQRVSELVAVPPVPVEVALLERAADGGWRVATATDDRFVEVAPQVAGLLEPTAGGTAVAVTADDLRPSERDGLVGAGYDVAWYAPVVVSGAEPAFHLVAACRDGLRYEMTVLERMRSAADLASVVLMRAEHDAQVLHAATHDSLTGLPNRRALNEHVEALVGAGRPSALLYIDLDGFKPVNDRYGHAVGDEVLCVVADRLRTHTRPGDVVARVGGDEFALSLAAPVDRWSASRRATELTAVIAEPIRTDGLGQAAPDVVVRASIGVAMSGDGADPDALLAAADTAMYEAKRRGGADRRSSSG